MIWLKCLRAFRLTCVKYLPAASGTMARNKGSIMGFVPQAIDANTVFGNLRVTLANNIHACERLLDVSLDTISDLTHCSAVLANSNWLSALELQQSLCEPANFRSAAASMSEHGARVWSNIVTYIDQCAACRQRAFDRLFPEA